MPQLSGLLETSLYVEDLERSSRFYRTLFGFESLFADTRLQALSVTGRQVLLLFKKRGSLELATPHDGDGNLHVAFAIPASELEGWRGVLKEKKIPIEEETRWERSGRSLYFRDPDHHLVELVTPGCWAIY